MLIFFCHFWVIFLFFNRVELILYISTRHHQIVSVESKCFILLSQSIVCLLHAAAWFPPPSWFTVFFQKSPSSQSSSLFKLWQMSNKHAFGSFDAWQGPEFCADLTAGVTKKKTCLIFERWIVNPAVFSWRLTICLNYRSVFMSNALSF